MSDLIVNPYSFAAGTFDPADYGTVHTWLDPTQNVSTSLGSVTTWGDSSGNGHDFINNSSGGLDNTSATQNSLPVITAGGSTFLTSNEAASTWDFLHDGTAYDIFMVCKITSSANPGTLEGLMETSPGTTSQYGMAFTFDDSSPENEALAFFVFDGSGYSGTVVRHISANGLAPPNTPQIVELQADPGNGTTLDRSAFVVDDGTPDTGNIGTDTPGSTTCFHTLYIGHYSNNIFNGWWGDIIIMTSVTNRAGLISALQSRWGL